jgi:hypothetical protein
VQSIADQADEQAVQEVSRVLAVRGRVLPSTLANVTLCAELADGRVLRGESQIGHGSSQIRRVFLDPPDAPAHPDAIAAILISSGFVVLQPNESAVLLLFGKYKYSAKVGGFWWVNPFYTKRKLSLRLRNHNGDRLKVNDKAGNRDRQRARLEGRGHVRRAF